MNPPAEIEVDVVYALPAEQLVVRVQTAAGATVAQALRLSGLLVRYPEITVSPMRFGVFGKIVTLETHLRSGDRVEIYRPLTVDPKEARRRRAKLRT